MSTPREDAWSEFYANPCSEEDDERQSTITPVPSRPPSDRHARLGEHPDEANIRRWREFYRQPSEKQHRETTASSTWDDFYGTGADGTAEPGSPRLAEPAGEPGEAVGAANPGWDPDYQQLAVDPVQADQEALKLLRDAPLTDAIRSEVTGAWARALQSEVQYTVDQGMAALRRACGSDARVAETIRDAHRALERAPDRVKDHLDRTQTGNHPAVILALAKAGRALRSRRRS